MNTTPTPEDRTWAVISHLSALAFGMGIVLPIIGWSDQRRKSNYASFQSLQALGYQSLGFTVWALSWLVIIIAASILLLAMLGSRGGSGQNMDVALRPLMLVIFIVVLGFFALYLLLPMIAAVACVFGNDFRYPIMGDRLARYLGYVPARTTEEPVWLIEDHEVRWVAALGHFSVIILLWGMLAPLTALILYGKNSAFLKFQSIQTFVFQIGATLLYFGVMLLYGIGLFSFIAATALTGQPEISSPAGMFGILIFSVTVLFAFLIALLVPVLHIVGQWAGYRVLKGDDYHYPLLGEVVERWLSKQAEARNDIYLAGDSDLS
jgi:uncharacterized Tic20 family protein